MTTTKFVISMVLLGVLVLTLGWLFWQTIRSQRHAYVMETTEEIDGERTLLANMVLAVLQFSMRDLNTDEPVAATSPDGHRSYFRVITPEGHVVIQFHWDRNRIYLFHAYHSATVSGMQHETLKIRNNLVDEIKLRDFGQQVATTELEIIEKKILNSDGFKNLVLQTLASARSENSEEENGGE